MRRKPRLFGAVGKRGSRRVSIAEEVLSEQYCIKPYLAAAATSASDDCVGRENPTRVTPLPADA